MPQTQPAADSDSTRASLRRRDQTAWLAMVVSGLVMSWSYWLVHGGQRGELIEIDRAQPLHARYLVDINQADWPEWTSLQFIEPLVFQASELPEIPFDDRTTPGIDAAEGLLVELLANGPRHFRQLQSAVTGAGLSVSSMVRAGRRLGISKVQGVWSLT